MATTDIYHVSGGLAGRKAAVFLGGDVNDYVQVDAFAVARTAANDTVGTISAWINVPDITGTYTILGIGDNNAVEFIDFSVEAGKLACRCTDATTAQFVSVTSNVVIQPHTWQHVAVVQNADLRGPQFFVNGVKVASTNSTTTDLNEWFANCDGLDTARIGASNKAGDASVTNEFKGAISDLKYWSVALTDTQILNDYSEPAKNATLNAASLESHWDFADDYIDNGLGADSGTVVGDVVLNNNYSEFTSRMRFMTAVPVVADAINFAIDSANNTGHAIVIQAA